MIITILKYVALVLAVIVGLAAVSVFLAVIAVGVYMRINDNSAEEREQNGSDYEA